MVDHEIRNSPRLAHDELDAQRRISDRDSTQTTTFGVRETGTLVLPTVNDRIEKKGLARASTTELEPTATEATTKRLATTPKIPYLDFIST